VNIEYAITGDDEVRQTYNAALFKSYFAELKKLADEVDVTVPGNIFELALASPDVVQSRLRDEVSEEDWQWVKKALHAAISKCEAFRLQEGKVLQSMLSTCCKKIMAGPVEVHCPDPWQGARIRERTK